MHKIKEVLMEKLDVMAEQHKTKGFTNEEMEFICKATETLENIATIEGMENYLTDMEMSGAPRRSNRTGRFVSCNDGMPGRTNRSFGDMDGGSYADSPYVVDLRELANADDPDMRKAAERLMRNR